MCGKEIKEIFSCNTMKISHLVTTLMKVKFSVHIVKHLTNITIANGDDSFAVIQKFIAFYWDI